MERIANEVQGTIRVNKDLFIGETRCTPEIRFNSALNEWTISGKSYPRDVSDVYDVIKNWIDDIEINQVSQCSFHFKLEYFNTVTSQVLINMLLKLKEKRTKNNMQVNVKWYYESDDEDMLETGESMMKAVSLPFEMVCI